MKRYFDLISQAVKKYSDDWHTTHGNHQVSLNLRDDLFTITQCLSHDEDITDREAYIVSETIKATIFRCIEHTWKRTYGEFPESFADWNREVC